MTEEQFILEFDNNSDFQMGVRQSVIALKRFLDLEINVDSSDGDFPEEWLGHIVATNGACNCTIDKVYDENSYEIVLCEDYNRLHYRRDWFCKWHGMTEEELNAKLRAEAAAKRREEVEAAERSRLYRLHQLRELAEEFGVDPRLLP